MRRITPTQCSPILNWSRKGVSGKLPFLDQFFIFCCLRSYMQWIIFCRFKSREHSKRVWCYIALLAHVNPQQQCCLWSSNKILEISALTILPQVWWLESPGRDILDPGLRWECVFLQGAKTLQTHITSADWVSNSHSWCRHNNLKSEPVPGICGVMPGASAALDLDKFSPGYKLQHDKLAQTKTALDIFLWEFLLLTS